RGASMSWREDWTATREFVWTTLRPIWEFARDAVPPARYDRSYSGAGSLRGDVDDFTAELLDCCLRRVQSFGCTRFYSLPPRACAVLCTYTWHACNTQEPSYLRAARLEAFLSEFEYEAHTREVVFIHRAERAFRHLQRLIV